MTRALLVALTALAVTGCGDPTPAATREQAAPDRATAGSTAVADDSVLGVASAATDLTTFVALARTAGLDSVLADTARSLTVFAPSNAAFDALGADDLAALRADPAALRARLLGHVLAYRLFSGDADVEQTVDALGGTALTLVPGDALTVRSGATNARIATPDLDADNGVVHVIDAVLGG